MSTIGANIVGPIRDGEFLSSSERDVVLRDRSGVVSQSLRRIEMLPPAEIDVGLTAIIRTRFFLTGILLSFPAIDGAD